MAEDFYDEYNREFDNDPIERVTDEDVWYALTDDMEGDYPGRDCDPEWFGF